MEFVGLETVACTLPVINSVLLFSFSPYLKWFACFECKYVKCITEHVEVYNVAAQPPLTNNACKSLDRYFHLNIMYDSVVSNGDFLDIYTFFLCLAEWLDQVSSNKRVGGSIPPLFSRSPWARH